MNRRLLMAGPILLVTLLVVVAPALADPGGGKHKGTGKGKNKAAGLAVQWKATSPAIHEGDRYTLLAANTSGDTQKARVRTVIMDHRNHTNTDVVDEWVELEPGEEREFTAVNDYGAANHFNTIIGSQTQDLELAVSVVDASGTETARFNQRAFMVQGGDAKVGNHAHGGGFAALALTALRDTARLSPLSLGVLAATGLGLYAARRRWAGHDGGLTGSTSPSPIWKVLAVGGLVLSAAFHVGLYPLHSGEAAVQGVFFLAAGVAEANVAAAILAWPSRLAYMAGAALSLALLSLWAVFLLVPPPGGEAVEAVDLVGLFTKATELVAATACAMLWSRDRRPGRTLE